MGTDKPDLKLVKDSETDFAMKYAAERKMRMEVEHRLMGLLYETVALHTAAHGLVEAVCTADGDVSQQIIKDLTDWRVDTESMVYLNLFKSAGKIKPLKERHLKYGNLEDLPDNGFQKLREQLAVHAKECFDEWQDFAQEQGLTPTGLIRNHYRAELLRMLSETGARREMATNETKH